MASIAPIGLLENGARGTIEPPSALEQLKRVLHLTDGALGAIERSAASATQKIRAARSVVLTLKAIHEAQEASREGFSLTMRGVPVDRIPAEQLRALTARAESLRGAQEAEPEGDEVP